MDTIKFIKNKTYSIAHRGVSGLECENTAAAFVAAGNRSYFGIETDVHKTADGKFIIIHDDNTQRVYAQNLSVENSNYDDLRKLRLKAGDGVTREDLCLPSLEEYIRICKTYDKAGVLEFKNPFEKEDIKSVLCTVRELYALEKMIFISFHYDNLVYVKELEPGAAVQYLCSCPVDNELIEKLQKYGMDLDNHHQFLDRNTVELLHRNGIKVNCWTVDDKCRAEALSAWGVDYITSNILE